MGTQPRAPRAGGAKTGCALAASVMLAALFVLVGGPARAQQPTPVGADSVRPDSLRRARVRSDSVRRALRAGGAERPIPPPPAAPAFELGEIVASAMRPVSEAAAGARVVDAALLRAHGARTLDEALALVPGMDVRTGGQGIPRVGFRGFRPRHLLVLLDGVPLNSTFDGQPDLSLIPADRIAYVKVTGTTASVLYGEALGGVVEVVTRDGASGLRGEASGELRSGPGRSGRMSASGGTGGLRFFASATGSATDAFPSLPLTGDGIVSRSNSARAWSSAFGTLSFGGARARGALLLSGVRASYGIPPSAIADTSDAFASRPIYERIPRLTGGSVQLSGSVSALPSLTLRGWTFLNAQDEDDQRYDDSTYASMSNAAVKGTFDETTHTRLTGAGLQVGWTPSTLARVTLALSGERDGWSLAGVIRDSALTSGSGSGGGSGGGGGAGGKGGGGGGGTSAPTWGLRRLSDARALRRFSAATEVQLTPASGLGFVVGMAGQGLARDSGGTRSAGAFSLGSTWEPRPGTRLRVSAARKVRFPTIQQLYDPSAGNPALAPERAAEVDIGADQRLSARFSAGLSLFRADVHDYIDRATNSAPFSNRGLLRFEGIEGVLQTRPAETLALDGSVAYLHTHDLSPGAQGAELQYTPRVRAQLRARWEAPADLAAAASLSRVLHQVYYSRVSPVRVGKLPDYTLLGVRITRPLPGGLQAYLGGDNLLDARYQDQYGFPRPARTLYGGLALTL